MSLLDVDYEFYEAALTRKVALQLIGAGSNLLNISDMFSDANDQDELIFYEKEMFRERKKYLSKVVRMKMTQEETSLWRELLGKEYFDEHSKIEA